MDTPVTSSRYSSASSSTSDHDPLSSRPASPTHPSSSFPSTSRPPLPPALAAQVLRHAVASGLSHAGFESAEEEAMEELEGIVYSFFGSLLTHAHQLAELGRRHQPNLLDVLKGSEDLGVGGARELLLEARKEDEAPALEITYKRPRAASPPPLLLPSDDESDLPDPSLLSPPPSPTFTAASDSDEDAEFEEVLPLGANGQPLASAVEAQERKKKEKKEKKDRREKEKEGRRKERERRRRERRKIEERNAYKAEWLPGLPPKHSWKQTPVYPQSAAPPPIPPPISQTQQAPSSLALAHLSTLRARLNDSQLVAASLRNLIRRTGARSSSNALLAAAPLEGEGEAEALMREQEQEAADVVDYESEWYGVKEGGAGMGGKRRIRVLTVGGGEDDEEEERRRGGKKGENGGAEWMEGSRVGGAGKRRRWLV